MAYTNLEYLNLIKEYRDSNTKENRLEEIRERILEENLKLIKSIAFKYKNEIDDPDDLIQEGYIALLDSIDTFDYSKQVKFTDFLTRKIESRMNSFIKETKTINLESEKLRDQLNKILDVEKELYLELNREPLEAEVAYRLNIDLDKLKELKLYVKDLLEIDPITFKDSKTLTDLVNSVNERDEIEKEENEENEIIEDLNYTISSLNEKERDIIELTFGLNGKEKTDISLIAKKYNVSVERIRQITGLIIRKIKREVMGEEYEN